MALAQATKPLRLKDFPSIMDYDADSKNDDSGRILQYAGHTELFMVLNNGFTYMTDAHNKYDTILEISEKANYGNIFMVNSAYGCDGTTYWVLKVAHCLPIIILPIPT